MRFFRAATVVVMLIAPALLVGCSEYLKPKHRVGTSEAISISKLSTDFASVHSTVLGPRCVECHAQYRSYRSVRIELDNILESIESGRMPKRNGPLSQFEIEILRAWARRGAPESAGTSPPEPDILEATWQSISERLIFPKCLICHNPNGEAKFLDLSSRQMIFEQRNRKFLGDQVLLSFEAPESSYLVQIIQDPVEPMPPIKSGITRLKPEEIAALVEWIRRGLP